MVIYVSKKLSGQQAELNDLVAELGGDYKWQYDASCTHFVFQVNYTPYVPVNYTPYILVNYTPYIPSKFHRLTLSSHCCKTNRCVIS